MFDSTDDDSVCRSPLVTVSEAARMTLLSRYQVMQAMRDGRLDVRRLGRRTMIVRASVPRLIAWMNKRRMPGAPACPIEEINARIERARSRQRAATEGLRRAAERRAAAGVC